MGIDLARRPAAARAIVADLERLKRARDQKK
ncbi:hypothetical protein FHX57_000892 [Paraburkholderia tropica]|nr:hypothetical protein [Paraburkholderia tropica]MBB6318661.1 hypothetical protein [Paraburkholderia tropica]